ncbi:GNAT family acetyltransferase [Clostridium botulinum A2 117]|uniref:GNAT family N-acetyltransferase n=1 Tax=Clostridium botulinum TaxID=1491 RepID=UPI0007E20DF4|nr:GNAT family N-acetyltransferase [Clostridium botulinum]KEI78000.1 GNAT family acetyltransferase [Clostridium botulinum A2 117]MBN3415177.1 GNAT family N-acetyltransferase [Clostridium botulinum]MBN3441470.1 GNAT family N-acetyltransferase [Clostridium botulinum]MBY6805536.1 GNAT family N-acetyltransferase [Clostridium botulinum]
MFIYDTLENIGIETLHETFLNAFSDYQVKMDLPLFKFQHMLQRRGYVPKVSIGAFNDDILVGFVLNGVRNWDGKLTAYDTGTGIIEAYRKQGITSNMLLNVRQLFQQMGVEQYLLEVIQSNTSALQLYKKQGFKILRDFECFHLDKNKYNPITTYKVEHVDMINSNDWRELIEFWDFAPSWQNSIDSINDVSDSFIYSIVHLDDNIVGYGVIDKKTGDIPQIAVNKNYRRKGIARSIITDLIKNTESYNINVINVDGRSKSMKDFLLKLGFECGVSQYEMILKL